MVVVVGTVVVAVEVVVIVVVVVVAVAVVTVVCVAAEATGSDCLLWGRMATPPIIPPAVSKAAIDRASFAPVLNPAAAVPLSEAISNAVSILASVAWLAAASAAGAVSVLPGRLPRE